ncbi:DUF2116 family Zn-ribbon domain-containing protein [Thomasclavelia cocleata]|uniref:DUF2116 family Zn-ribbon domain-containing protein n=1 Tax=Thomasclavelia cocleata TaxID=69824 RepID=UPI00257081CC|nr:DUF2116 family Zn-ribbon domain-containing protein [Thomasclavelia cocleata]
MLKKCVVCGKEFNSKNGVITCSAECREIATKEKKKKYFKNYYEGNKDEIIKRIMRNKKR